MKFYMEIVQELENIEKKRGKRMKRLKLFVQSILAICLLVAVNGQTVYGTEVATSEVEKDKQTITKEQYYAGNQLQVLGILKGYGGGDLRLEKPIKRVEVAALTVRIMGYENSDIEKIEGFQKVFTDIETTYWGYPYIQKASKLEIINGYGDDTFRSENSISYAETIAIMINALGYKEEIVGEWPMNYINKAKEIGVIPAKDEIDPNKKVTRGEMALIVWDSILVRIK